MAWATTGSKKPHTSAADLNLTWIKIKRSQPPRVLYSNTKIQPNYVI